MIYRVVKQYLRGPEIPCQSFSTLEDAKAFVKQQVAADVAMKIKIKYLVYEFDEICCEYDTGLDNYAESNSSHSSQGSRFNPTPLGFDPRPPGMQTYLMPEEDD